MGPRQCGQVLESLRLRERSVGALQCSLRAPECGEVGYAACSTMGGAVSHAAK